MDSTAIIALQERKESASKIFENLAQANKVSSCEELSRSSAALTAKWFGDSTVFQHIINYLKGGH